MLNLNLPLTAEEDHADRVYEAHRDCACEGVLEPCECYYPCPCCNDIREAIADAFVKKARQYR